MIQYLEGVFVEAGSTLMFTADWQWGSFNFCLLFLMRYYHWYYEYLIEISTHNLSGVPTLIRMGKADDPATIQRPHFLLRNEHSKCGNVDGFYWTVNLTITNHSWKNTVTDNEMGHSVAQMVEALRYKSKSRGFDSRCCHWNVSFDIIFPIVLRPWGWLSLWHKWERNRDTGGRCVGLTNLPHSCADCLEI